MTAQVQTLPLGVDEDWFLQCLVGMVDKSDIGISFGITIASEGLVISGELISSKLYFTKFGESFAGAVKGLDGEDRNDLIKSFEPNAQLTDGLPHFIHIDKPKIVDSKGVIHAPLWRGRISAVSGFTFGSASI